MKIGFVTAHLNANPVAITGIEMNGLINRIIVNPTVYNNVALTRIVMLSIEYLVIKAPIGIINIKVTNQNIPLI